MLAVGQALVSWKWLPLDALAMGLSYDFVENGYKGLDRQLHGIFIQCHRAALCDPDQSTSINDCEKAKLEGKKYVNITYSPECVPPCTAPKCLAIWMAAREIEHSFLGTAANIAWWVFEASKWHTSMVLAKQIYSLTNRFIPA